GAVPFQAVAFLDQALKLVALAGDPVEVDVGEFAPLLLDLALHLLPVSFYAVPVHRFFLLVTVASMREAPTCSLYSLPVAVRVGDEYGAFRIRSEGGLHDVQAAGPLLADSFRDHLRHVLLPGRQVLGGYEPCGPGSIVRRVGTGGVRDLVMNHRALLSSDCRDALIEIARSLLGVGNVRAPKRNGSPDRLR